MTPVSPSAGCIVSDVQYQPAIAGFVTGMATISRVLPLLLSGFCISASVNLCSAAPDDVSPRPTTWFSITGSGTNSIADLATDADGNLYIAGTTTSPDLPVKNAAQAEFA